MNRFKRLLDWFLYLSALLMSSAYLVNLFREANAWKRHFQWCAKNEYGTATAWAEAVTPKKFVSDIRRWTK